MPLLWMQVQKDELKKSTVIVCKNICSMMDKTDNPGKKIMLKISALKSFLYCTYVLDQVLCI